MAQCIVPLERSGCFHSQGRALFISSGSPQWIQFAQNSWHFPVVTLKVGSFAMMIFGSDPEAGFYVPSIVDTLKALKVLKLDLYDDELVTKMNAMIPCTTGKIVLEIPRRISFKTTLLKNSLTLRPSLFFHLIRQPTIVAMPELLDPFRDQKKLFGSPDVAHADLQAVFGHGEIKKINAAAIHEIAEIFLGNLEALYSAALCDKVHSTFSAAGKYTFHVSKDKDEVTSLTICFDKHVWKGGYKKVYLSMKASHFLKPLALAVTSEHDEFVQEVKFRKDSALKSLFTPLAHSWAVGSQKNLLTGLACYGSFASVFDAEQDLSLKDTAASKLLSKMHIFHQHAVHKDLNLNNILLDNTPFGFEVYINDLGLSAYEDEHERHRIVTTNAVNLAPEILSMARDTLGVLNWEEPPELDLTYQHWLASERFSLGLMLAKIYLGRNPYEMVLKQVELFTKHPALLEDFETLKTKHLVLYTLDEFLSSDDKWDLEAVYRNAYDRYFSTLEHEDEEAEDGDDDVASRGTTESAESYDRKYEAMFNDHAERVKLEPFLKPEDLERAHEIYTRGFESLSLHVAEQQREEIPYTKLRDTRIAELMTKLQTNVIDSVESTDPDLARRLSSIKPLLSLDPNDRPDFATIRAALHDAIRGDEEA